MTNIYLIEPDLPLQVLDVGLLVEGDVGHVLEEAAQLQAAQMHGHLHVQGGGDGVEVSPEVVGTDLE